LVADRSRGRALARAIRGRARPRAAAQPRNCRRGAGRVLRDPVDASNVDRTGCTSRLRRESATAVLAELRPRAPVVPFVAVPRRRYVRPAQERSELSVTGGTLRSGPRSSADRAADFESACGGSTPPGAMT